MSSADALAVYGGFILAPIAAIMMIWRRLSPSKSPNESIWKIALLLLAFAGVIATTAYA